MAIIVDREQLLAISNACKSSSDIIQQEATKMQQQMENLREALSGIPNLSLADRFSEWNALFAKMSAALDESDAYLKNVVSSVDDFIAQLGR